MVPPTGFAVWIWKRQFGWKANGRTAGFGFAQNKQEPNEPPTQYARKLRMKWMLRLYVVV